MRTLLISDLHIGFRYSRASDVVKVLEEEVYDRLILVGDIFDIQQMLIRPFWNEDHTRVLKLLLKIAKYKEVVYIIGNHDYPLEYLRKYTRKIAGIYLYREYEYESGGKHILCMHGDQIDGVSHRWQFVGDFLYNLGLRMNPLLGLFGISSKWCKDKVKSFIKRAFNMDERIEELLEDYDVFVYGHTHMPEVSERVVNTGTFVEIATYVIEEKGVFKLLTL